MIDSMPCLVLLNRVQRQMPLGNGELDVKIVLARFVSYFLPSNDLVAKHLFFRTLQVYTPGPEETLTNFEVHLKNKKHRDNVSSRLAKERVSVNGKSS